MCARCLRSADEHGVVLQVHHVKYLPGRRPWEYGHTDCEALCKGCHAVEHGKIMPQFGWQLDGWDDLGDLIGNCELCGTDLRYIHAVHHPDWGSMAVGTDCCDHLTQSTTASEHHARHTKTIDMKKRFVGSKRWKSDAFGNLCIRQKGIDVKIEKINDSSLISMNNIAGRERFPTALDAKIKVFETIDSGQVIEYFARMREKRKKELMESLGFQEVRGEFRAQHSNWR